ncbi:Protein-export protein SecB [Hartmannibacter diazotrophicus]|uniref:Protein-export protein SecB n=1 Tax=Hartmannibacter diazotrophicus TaxID=1482074 RepID=A0A2C9DDL0_9HYPH|nr:protein-export chaperone SecB [Hartmannibacter diazotrophicus]SON58188.1 Protein-export protein SecB [Hartmannibacter diazotrophicus]
MSSVEPGNNSQPSATAQPSLNVVAQYIKDLSFENPRAPMSLVPRDKAPSINVNVNVVPKARAEGEYEVDLKLEAMAKHDDDVVFALELTYGGVFRVQNVPEQHLHAFVMIECPRMIFPFARQIIAETTRNGGFMPLMIDPIDFVALYQNYLQRMAQQAQQQQETPVN